jgi:NAD+ kinase
VSESRRVLIVAHTRRDEALEATLEVVSSLQAQGIKPIMTGAEQSELLEFAKTVSAAGSVETVGILGVDAHVWDIEVVIVLGGDGTILKAAEIVRESNTPLLGINLGHVGFLAESERDGIAEAVARVVSKDYTVIERMTLEVSVVVEGKVAFRTWALNEATVEKSAAEKMIEVVVEVDGRPLTSFGCDGIVLSTPTGSTAYAFSAGGPVVWPSVEALLVVPLSAHALFSRPLVVSPHSMLAVEVLQRSAGHGELWCDGRRTQALPPGARVEVKQSEHPVRLARFREGAFTDRLVRKFELPVSGWRGPDKK